MGMSCNLFFLLSILSILTSILVVVGYKPVHSVFFLISSFILLCGNLFLLELEFLPLILIVIYVGAISILFLFVIMMLDIKFVIKKQDNFSLIFVGLFFIFLFCIFSSLKDSTFFDFKPFVTKFNWFNLIDKFVSLNSLGQYLFLDFVVHFLVVGLILLVAIIGAVILTLQFNIVALQKNKGQFLFKQVVRTNLETYYLL